VLSGRDSGTHWSADGRGNYWSRYRGFDFDGDGIGEAPHPLVGAFERLEGANPAARIFLQSPAAAGLELAARLGGLAATDAIDDRPVTQPSRPAAPGSAGPIAGIVGVAALFIRGCTLRHPKPAKGVPCLR
jgi:nitrous oxidase accessory protein